MLDEKDLISACSKGDRKAQHQLYEMFSPQMYPVCLRYAKSELEAEDILQEAFIKIFAKIDTFRSESSLFHWIKRVVINTALNSSRGKLYMFPMVDIDYVGNTFEYEQIISSMNYADLLQLIQELPGGCRAVFNLYAVEGYPHKEIAKMLNVSEGTSKSQYSRAKALLQEKLMEITKNEQNGLNDRMANEG